MKNALGLFGVMLLACVESSARPLAPSEQDSATQPIESTSLESSLSQTDSSKVTKRSPSLYQPIALSKSSYGSFSIGYSQSHIQTKALSVVDSATNTRVSRGVDHIARGVFFGLERGMHWHNFMLGGYVNGVAAQDYSLSFGVRASYLIARYVVPSVGISWKLQHIQFPNDTKQYNIHGASFNAGLFVNIVRGFGLKLEGSYSYPLVILRGVDARAYGDPIFSGYAFAVSLCLYDFSI